MSTTSEPQGPINPRVPKWAKQRLKPSRVGEGRGWRGREASGLQESLRHEVEVPEGSLLAGGEGAAGGRVGRGQAAAP